MGVEALARVSLLPGKNGEGGGEPERAQSRNCRRKERGGSAGHERLSAGNPEPMIRRHGQLSLQGQDPRTLARMPGWLPGCPEAVQRALTCAPHSPPERSIENAIDPSTSTTSCLSPAMGEAPFLIAPSLYTRLLAQPRSCR